LGTSDHVSMMKGGSIAWNSWRAENSTIRPDLSDVDFESHIHTYKHLYDTPLFEGFNLSGANLNRISARNSRFIRCTFDGSEINYGDLCFSHFTQCSFRDVSMRVTKMGSTSFIDCTFDQADLAYSSAEDTDFSKSRILNSSLNSMMLIKTNFSSTVIDNTSVYGISAWDLIVHGSSQRDIIISDDDNIMTVDNIEIAQFVHLLLRNAGIREVIDTITSKVVLILGRFTPDRKAILDELRDRLRKRNYVPVLFDFKGPRSRDLTETISTLAHLSRFVIADLTEPRSIPQELATIVPQLPSVPVQPIIAAGHTPFGMFEHFERYPWVLAVREYRDHELSEVVQAIITACEDAKAQGK